MATARSVAMAERRIERVRHAAHQSLPVLMLA